jgi:hypothetical protein
MRQTERKGDSNVLRTGVQGVSRTYFAVLLKVCESAPDVVSVTLQDFTSRRNPFAFRLVPEHNLIHSLSLHVDIFQPKPGARIVSSRYSVLTQF